MTSPVKPECNISARVNSCIDELGVGIVELGKVALGFAEEIHPVCASRNSFNISFKKVIVDNMGDIIPVRKS
jgi:hypothetical protein